MHSATITGPRTLLPKGSFDQHRRQTAHESDAHLHITLYGDRLQELFVALRRIVPSRALAQKGDNAWVNDPCRRYSGNRTAISYLAQVNDTSTCVRERSAAVNLSIGEFNDSQQE
jgi:hypothetical protein